MPVLGITGSVACGKSLAAKHFAQVLGANAISTDQIAGRLLSSDSIVRSKVVAEFGSAIVLPDGGVDKVRLREMVFSDKELRLALESILHPLIRAHWVEATQPSRGFHSTFCIVEIPLLFETKAEVHCDATITVGCDRQIQIQRILRTRNLEPCMAASMIDAQMPLVEKMARAHHVLWNDGSLAALHSQIDRLADLLKSQQTACG